jgi:ubiquinone/menaquinone biosynthesis C-methylase UbiE
VLNADITRRTYFGEKASRYDEGRETEEKWQREHAAVRDFLAQGTVLDIPVGTGRFLSLYREMGLTFKGMDVSEEMMAQAWAKDPAADISFGDIMRIPLPDRSVDIAVCIRLLTLIDTPDMVAAMKELGRVARSRIILSIKTAKEKRMERRSVIHSDKDFRSVVDEIGFRVVDERMARAPEYRVLLCQR